jgi:outer membrane protein assembly factor BamB
MSADDQNVYLAAGAHVYVVRIADGKEYTVTADAVPVRYPQAASTRQFYGAPQFTADGDMIVASTGGEAESFLIFSGTPYYYMYSASFMYDGVMPETQATYTDKQIQKGAHAWIGAPLLLGDQVFIGDGQGDLYCFNLKGGATKIFAESDHGIWSAPVTDGNLVFFTSLDRYVYAVDPKTCEKKWSQELDGAIHGSPVVGDGAIYVGTLNGSMYALDSAAGTIRWNESYKGWVWGGAALKDGILYFGTSNASAGMIYAVDAKDGSILWSYEESGAILASPLVLDDQLIYVTETGLVQSRALDGTPKWQDTIADTQIYTAPLAAGDWIVIAPMNGEFLLYAFDHNGATKWTFAPQQ